MEDALNRYPDLGVAVGLFGYNPPLILEALKGADALGRVKVVGFDEDKATLEGVRSGTIVGTVVQDPYAYGRESVRILAGLHAGRSLAEDLLPSYTDVQAITLEIPAEVTLHARPIALLVAVVHHHGTPVELELAGKVANAGSILEVMILAGANPEHRELVFRGDTRPLEDLRRLFEAGIGEWGLERLPEDLDYLRG